MARAPSSPGKTRLARDVPAGDLQALREALLADTLATVCAVDGVDVTVFATPEGAGPEIQRFAPRPVRVLPQRGPDLGARMHDALTRLIDVKACGAAMVVGTDTPLLTPGHIVEAAAVLSAHDGVVIGPADDGGYYLIGMKRVRRGMFEQIAWGSGTALADTLAAAKRLQVTTYLIRGTYDVDTIDDLRRLERELAGQPPAVAKHVRQFFSSRATLR
jgi:rSAM/selenodomain-associated transferase 1